MSCSRFCNAGDLPIHNIPPGLMSTLLRLPRSWQFTARNIAKHLPEPPTPGEIDYISQFTCEQSENTHWHHLRHGRLTGSAIGDIFKYPGYWSKWDIREPTSLIKRVLGYYPQPHFIPPACAFGLLTEPIAAKLYQDQLQLPIDQESVHLKRVGLCISPKESWIAASPDFIVELLPSGTRYLVEVKSFVTLPNVSTFKDLLAARGPNYLPYYYDSEGNVCCKRNHKHFFQIQCQLYVTSLAFCDLVMFYNGNIQVVRVDFDKTWWETDVYPELYVFYFRFIVPEMYFRRVKRGISLYRTPIVCNKRKIDQVD